MPSRQITNTAKLDALPTDSIFEWGCLIYRQDAAAAEALAGDRPGTYYDQRLAELAARYSKPMLPEQLADLDGIESSAAWLRLYASDLRV